MSRRPGGADVSVARRLIIFEGPDAAGKTTMARHVAREIRARYVHLGPFPGVSNSALSRFYAEAISPAVTGLADVVLDRSWLSEPIYGKIFRGSDRVGVIHRRMLERGALGCQTVVALCMPPLERVLSAFTRRSKDGELPKGTGDVEAIYAAYLEAHASGEAWTSLPVVTLNPFDELEGTRHRSELFTAAAYNSRAGSRAPLGVVGNPNARTVVVTSGLPGHTDRDALVRWPFTGFGDYFSMTLTGALKATGVDESEVAWLSLPEVPTSQYGRKEVATWLETRGPENIIVLGDAARSVLNQFGVEFISVKDKDAYGPGAVAFEILRSVHEGRGR